MEVVWWISIPSLRIISLIDSSSVTYLALNLGSRNEASSSSSTTSEAVFRCDNIALRISLVRVLSSSFSVRTVVVRSL